MSMLFKRIKDWATSITAFRTGDVIPVDGPSGTAKIDASLIATSASLVGNTFDIAFKQNMVRKVRQAVWVDSVNTISYPANLVAQKNLYFVPKAGAKLTINEYGNDDTTLIGSSGFQTTKVLVKKGENFVVNVRKVDESYLYPSDADDVFYIEDAGEIEGLKDYLANGSFNSSGTWLERSEDAKNVTTNKILFAEKAVRLHISSNVKLMVIYWNDSHDTQNSYAYWLTDRDYTIPKGSNFSLTFRDVAEGAIIPSNVIDEFTAEEIELDLAFYKLTASGSDYIKDEDYAYLTSDIKKAEKEIVLDVASGFKVTTLFWNDDKLKTSSYYRGVSPQTRPVTIPKGMIYSYSVQTNTGTAIVYADALEVIKEQESNSIVADGMLSKGCTLKETEIVSSGFIPQYKEFEQQFGFIGRWFADVQDGVLCMQTTASGSEIHFKTYQCTSVSLQFKLMTTIEPTYIAYNIDGGAFTRLSIPNDGIVTITLTNSYPHYVRVVMDSCFFFMGDVNQSNSKYKSGIAYCFVGGFCNQGGRIVSVLPTNKSVVFFGDSITEGLGALGEIDINEPWDERHYSENSSSIASWPFILSQKLNVIPYKAGYGSDGYMRDDGSFHKFLIELTTLKDNLLASEYIPNLVILAHGQNDYDVGDYSTFVSSAREAFEWCHSFFPGVQILQVVPFARSGLKTRLDQAASGLPYVHVIDTTGWNISTNGDGVHPDVAGHLQAANFLEPIVKPYLYTT